MFESNYERVVENQIEELEYKRKIILELCKRAKSEYEFEGSYNALKSVDIQLQLLYNIKKEAQA